MDDFHSLNAAINAKAGRKLGPSILVSIAILATVFLTMSYAKFLFAIVAWIAIGLAARELTSAYKAGGIALPVNAILIALTAILGAAWFGRVSSLAVAMAITIPTLLVYILFKNPKDFVRNSTAAAFAIFYLPFLAGFILLLANDKDGLARIFTLVVLVSCNDTFAYIFGVLFGKHPLAPNISPKKTWEGLIGSIIATTIGSALVFEFALEHNWWIGAAIGLVAVITATCGDLIESAVKRDLAIKDMGSILPGHGGILDRIDSVLFTGPAVWFALELIKHFKL
ncbi:MAG: phosphatidate cytidylyltransferase [Actinomycetota bacterium]|jgi:phosphatidate cytidylyltransferase|tara:strand:+ start:2227 stop:3075 length:849 start_codon:yes stop_codon:yes gene_type:complete